MSWPQNDLWDRLEAELFRRLGPERYADWVRNVRPLSLDEEEFVVHFETTYARDKFEGLRASVTAAVRRATNRKIRVRFRVEGDSFARPPGADLQDETRRGGILRALPQTFDTFVEGPGNRTALEATRAFASAEPPPFRTLLIHAPSGLGKTHLLRAVGARLSERPRTSVLLFTGEQFARHFDCALSEGHREAFLKRCRSVHALLLDDLHLLAGREEAQRAFLETVLNLEDRGGRAAFTCERPPHQVEGLLRALKSRLRGDCVVTLGRPDPATSAAFLRTCAPPGTPPSVLDHLATHVRTSYKDQMNCLRRVLELGPPTLPAARAVVRKSAREVPHGCDPARRVPVAPRRTPGSVVRVPPVRPQNPREHAVRGPRPSRARRFGRLAPLRADQSQHRPFQPLESGGPSGWAATSGYSLETLGA